MNFEAVIGLEIHVELKTKTKMFSSAPVAFGKEPNSCCMPLDLGFPGTLPTVNKEAVIYGIRVANALHMDIDHELHFDRKNYFYPAPHAAPGRGRRREAEGMTINNRGSV